MLNAPPPGAADPPLMSKTAVTQKFALERSEDFLLQPWKISLMHDQRYWLMQPRKEEGELRSRESCKQMMPHGVVNVGDEQSFVPRTQYVRRLTGTGMY